MARLFVDSGDLGEIRSALETGVISGVTTNPGILASAKVRNVIDHARQIREVMRRGHLSVEVTETGGYSSALYDAAEIHDRVQGVTVKVPLHPDWGLPLIRYLGDAGISVNATCLMTPMQCVLAEAAGAGYVSLFYNRMIDSYTLPGPTATIKEYLKSYSPEGARRMARADITKARGLLTTAKLICGSIRRPEDVTECIEAGADIVTIPYKHLGPVLEVKRHPKTDEAIREFDEKWRSAAKVPQS